MNPFDLAGPQFLVFYAALAAVTLAVLVLHRQGTEGGPAVVLSDPYEIAYLRDGWQEAVRLAIASLIDRGLVDSSSFALAEGVTPEQGHSTLEQRVLARCAEGTTPQRLIDDLSLQGGTEEIRASLARQGLLPDGAVAQQRRDRLGIVQSVLLGTAFIKAGVALSRGHTNLGFLLILAVLASLAAVRLSAPRRTSRGDQALHHLSVLLAPIAEPSRDGTRAPDEAALVGAVFGLTAVAGGSEWAEIARLRSRPAESGSSKSSSCGSASCGSSSSGSSGGDGGGGCGGGGCGGCGS